MFWSLLLILCFLVFGLSVDRLWEAVFDASVERVETILVEAAMGDDILKTGEFQTDVTRVEAEDGRNALMMCGYRDLDKDGSTQNNVHNRKLVDESCATIAEKLHHAGANISHVDDHGWDALAMGAVSGMTQFCDYILKNSDVDVNRVDHEGISALVKAVGHGHTSTVEVLVSHGANLALRDPNGRTALMHLVGLAMANEKLYLSKLQEFINMYVLEPSQRLQEKEKKKQTQKNGEALKFDSNEMSIDLPVDSNGRTPLHYAVIGNSYKVAELLLKHGADHSRIDSFSTTPINMVRNPDTAEGQKMLDLLLNASVKKQQDSHDEFMKQREMEMEFEGDLLSDL